MMHKTTTLKSNHLSKGKNMRSLIVLLSLASLAGCAYNAPLMSESVDVTGKVTSAGAPVGDLVVTFQPLESGHMTPVTVASDGSFQAKMVPGKYAYFVSTGSGTEGMAGSKLPPKFFEPDLGRFISVTPDQSSFEIALD